MRKSVLVLLVIGLLQMLGDLLQVPALKAVAAATAASPAPTVFSSVRGLETFSTRFFIEWTDASRRFRSTEITPERTEGLLGPYNRRNVYGAVLAYGPVMRSDPRTRPMFDSVSQFALCGRAPLLRELAIDPQTISGNLHLRLQTRPGLHTSDLQLQFEAPCK